MLHWIDATAAAEFTFNDWENNVLVSRALNPVTGAVRTIKGAIAAVSPTAPACDWVELWADGTLSSCRRLRCPQQI